MFALVCSFAMAQVQQTPYRGAFAPAPTAMWTNGWTNFDPNNAVYGNVTTAVTADITSNVTWTKDKVYELTKLITVRNNATLTIQAGTVIRTKTLAAALVITRGSKLNAIGTLAEPIVFTSKAAAGSRQRGDWGGIVLLGKGRYNLNNGVNYIEGISQNVNTEFGGGLTPDDNDNSGTLKYVRIEYAGYVFAPNNELNGLTMGAVGKGTTIDYVQVSYSNDDSFEWFGGSVDCKHLVAFNGLDDDFDTDNGYKGICQYGLSIKDPNNADISTSECFESDNNAAGTATAVAYGDFTSAVFTNYTCIGANSRYTLPNGGTLNSLHDKALRLRRASQLKVFNSIFVDFKTGLVIESTLSNGYAANTTGGDLLKFRNNIIVSPAATRFLAPNATTSTSPTNAEMVTWFDEVAKDNKTIVSNTGILERAYDATDAQNYKTITDNSDTVNIDYRPSSADAKTGAAFTDPSLFGLLVVGAAPGVSNKTYCKGVVAPALNANLTSNGVSLRWFTTATIPLTADKTDPPTTTVDTNVAPYTVAPVPATSVVGSKKYYVREVDVNGVLSAAATITVEITPSPLVALGTITSTLTDGGAVATAAVGPYVGTTTQLTYTVPASSEVGVVSYLWSVPLGANIISGQGTNTVVVNYNNVASGLLKIGNIGVQAVNGGGCPGVMKVLAITAVLPAAPAAIKMTDALLPIPTTTGIAPAVTSFAKYMGQTTPLVLTATPVAAARAYVWELPTGVNLLNLGTVVPSTTTNPNPTTLFYSVFPFTVPGSRPTAVGNQYFQVVSTLYTSGVRIATASRFVVGGKLTNNALVAPVGGYMATSSTNTTATSVQDGSVGVFRANAVGAAFTQVNGFTVDPAFPITTTTSNVISVNFAGVTSGNTYNYMTTAAVPVSTNVLRIGVRSINGVGVSLTSNATAVDPVTSSTAKLLTLKATLPAAPSVIKMTNDAVSTSTAVTVISKFVGTTTPFTLTATPSALASSYSWELPAGVNALSSLTSNVITVNFADVAPGTTSLYIGVKAVNGIGSSNTSTNGTLVPATTSTAKLLKLTATVPAAVTIVTGQIAGVCAESSYAYTMTPSLLATSYLITAPTGSVVTSASNMSNTSNVLASTDLTFTVTYPAAFVATTTAPKSLVIASVNGVGNSLLNKTLVLSTLMPSVGTATGGTAFNRCETKTISVPMVIGATSYAWTVADGATIVSGQGTNEVVVDFALVPSTKTTNIVRVAALNACGTSSLVKLITLASTACPVIITSSKMAAITISSTEVYPNPVSSEFSIDVTASRTGVLQIGIYSLDGNAVVSPKAVKLQASSNTINENVSSLKKGIYIVRLVNTSNNEVTTKKLIKN